MTGILDPDDDPELEMRELRMWVMSRRDRLQDLVDRETDKSARGQLLARIGELDEVLEEIDAVLTGE
jgi:hypothetical protein